MFLAIDSSMGTSVAVISLAGEILSEHTSEDPRAHAESIGVLLQQALEQARVSAEQITAVVMGVGPGPYTGLRVGMAAAQAFALSRDLPLLPVVSHDASGWFHPEDCVVLTDQRRGEVAYSIYRSGTANRRSAPPELARPQELDQVLGDAKDLPRIVPQSLSAGALGLVALDYHKSGVAWGSPAPVYLRTPDVTVKS
jgi:tRNA threonylcarbamoyl adenosine modification protein YeaZ